VVDLPCNHHAYTSTLVAGRIERIVVGPGEKVEAGQELARLESMELETLQAALLAADSELALDEQLLAQKQKVVESGGAPRKDVLALQAKVREAKAHFEIAKRKLISVGMTAGAIQRLLAGEADARTLAITSPIAGAISAIDVRVGQAVEPLDHLFHIVDRSNVMIVGHVLESDAGAVKIGMPVTVTLTALGDREFAGRVDHVALKVDRALRTVPVRLHLDNPDELLRPGMFGRMRIQVERRAECVLSPSEATFEHEGESCVLLRQGPGRFVRRRVTLGGTSRRQTEIVEGLFPGQRVVTVGRHELAAVFEKAAGHEHKAVVTGDAAAGKGAPLANRASRQIVSGRVVVQGQVEMPTGNKRFATTAVEGRIKELLVERGDPVRAGQVLATIDSLELRNLQFELLDARAKLAVDRDSLERLKGLGSAVAQTPIWQLEAQCRTLETGLRSTGEKLRLVGLASSEINQLEELDLSTADAGQIATTLAVRAPADGWVVEFELGLGQVVRPADVLFEIQDLSTVWVQAYVFERDASRVRLGQEVEVTVVAEPGLVARGTIDRINPVLDGHDRLLAVWTELDNPQQRLKEGMLARVEIAVDDEEPRNKVTQNDD
ncbi:MAG TPA: efflux RND transporter periplasmic adaptor subunit, partial [Pirellulales bacterium]|nr:efflux RND transporter periplasmic adaptor subunit [Pirellulales bacterium]